jgi:hypothetical protein
VTERMRRMREKRKRAGLCIVCGAPVVPDKIRCQKHLDQDADRQAKAAETEIKRMLDFISEE